MLNKKCKESKDLSFDIKKKGLAPYFRDLIGVQNFYTHLYYFNYFVISYRRNIIPLDDWDLINYIIIKVMDYVIGDFRGQSDGRPTRCSATRSCLVFFFLTRFLQNALTDFHEIFRDGVYWSRKTENIFSCDDVISGLRYWRFSDFEGVILWRYLLRNDSRYLQIFTDDRQRPKVYKL